MNNKALTLSIIMAVLAVFFVQSYVSSIEDEQKKKFGTEVLVVTAKHDIKEMQTINETLFDLTRVPKKFLEPAAIEFDVRTDENAKAKSDRNQYIQDHLIGSVALVPIKKGEQITFNKLTQPGLRTGLAPQITPGKRAFTINVTDTTGVAKLIKPGDRVDVVSVIGLTDKKESKVAKTVLQDVVVLAVGKYVTNNIARTVEIDPNSGKEKVHPLTDFEGFNTVTLEVEPAQVQTLAMLSALGENSMYLTLRNNDDNDRVPAAATTFMDIFGAEVSRLMPQPMRRPSGR